MGERVLEMSFVLVRLLNFPKKETSITGPETNTQKRPEGLAGDSVGRRPPFLSAQEEGPLGGRRNRGFTAGNLEGGRVTWVIQLLGGKDAQHKVPPCSALDLPRRDDTAKWKGEGALPQQRVLFQVAEAGVGKLLPHPEESWP